MLANQDNFEGDPVTMYLPTLNPGVTITGLTGLPNGITLTSTVASGVTSYFLSGTIGWDACDDAVPDPCSLSVRVSAAGPDGTPIRVTVHLDRPARRTHRRL